MLTWLKQQIRTYFGFSKTETNGVLVLICFISTCLVTPIALRYYYKHTTTLDPSLDAALLDSLVQELTQQTANPKITKQDAAPKTGHSDFTTKQLPRAHQPLNKPLDINVANATQLQQIKGIDAKLAIRISRYRNKLGGFISQKQYLEVYGCTDLLYASLTKYTYIAPDFQPKQLHINTADFKTLLAHPYLTYEQVKKIMRFKAKHKPFANLEDLVHLKLLDETTFCKIKPYLKN
jgi:competence protein ComEA